MTPTLSPEEVEAQLRAYSRVLPHGRHSSFYPRPSPTPNRF
jgi:hypothetical protein